MVRGDLVPINATRDSVFTPALKLLQKDCRIDPRTERIIIHRLEDIAAAIQSGECKRRPCVATTPTTDKNLRGDNAGTVLICLMATFGGAEIEDIPHMLRFFVTPVLTGSSTWDISGFSAEDCLSTTPPWTSSNDADRQWVICYPYPVAKSAVLGKWSQGSNFYFDSLQQQRLQIVCKKKHTHFMQKVEKSGKSGFKQKMLDSLVTYAKGPYCASERIFRSNATSIPFSRCSTTSTIHTFATHQSWRQSASSLSRSRVFEGSVKENPSATSLPKLGSHRIPPGYVTKKKTGMQGMLETIAEKARNITI